MTNIRDYCAFVHFNPGYSSVGKSTSYAGGRRFESNYPDEICLSSSAAEHFLGKERVVGSTPMIGSQHEPGL